MMEDKEKEGALIFRHGAAWERERERLPRKRTEEEEVVVALWVNTLLWNLSLI